MHATFFSFSYELFLKTTFLVGCCFVSHKNLNETPKIVTWKPLGKFKGYGYFSRWFLYRLFSLYFSPSQTWLHLVGMNQKFTSGTWIISALQWHQDLKHRYVYAAYSIFSFYSFLTQLQVKNCFITSWKKCQA